MCLVIILCSKSVSLMSTQQSADSRPLNDGVENIVIGLTKGINGISGAERTNL